MELIETTKKKPSLIDGSGFQYRQHRKNKDGTISWLCIKFIQNILIINHKIFISNVIPIHKKKYTYFINLIY